VAEPSRDALATLVAPHLPPGQHLARLVPIGTGKHNRSYWVEAAAGDRWVLRVAPADHTGLLFYERRMMRQEPDLHRLIRARTTIPVAEIIVADFTRARLDRDWLLLSALPGRPMSQAGLNPTSTGHVLASVGHHLRQLHALLATDCLGQRAYGYLGAHQPMLPQPTWEAAFGLMWNRLLDDVVACGCYTPEQADTLRAAYERHRHHFGRPVEPHLLHMDIWAENILVDEHGQVSGLVDFDRALWGDPEIEFAVLDYCGISQPPFWAGYGRERDVSPAAQIRQRFYLLYELQKYMPIAVWRRHDPAGAQGYRAQALALAEPILSSMA
jgi:fructosamine-3-kinase